MTPITLEGAHVKLEPLSESHHEALCKIGLDPELWKWIPFQVLTPEQMTAYIRSALADQEKGISLPFATIDQATQTVVGSTRYMNIDLANKRLEIGSTWIVKPWQRTAINSEAKYLMMRHAFETLGCNRVEWKTDALNTQSRNAILRLGATEEGIFRQHVVTWSGRLRDSVYFSVIASEWPEVKKNLAAKIKVE
ncbi:MAG TPA: GNAT family protein [Bryobacteraceae bacterium]|jgi:RimJ/RimL family protein N-acetyltransferase|nr:GNAT family protein [Bryobacteraceae bacterium]